MNLYNYKAFYIQIIACLVEKLVEFLLKSSFFQNFCFQNSFGIIIKLLKYKILKA